MCDQQTLELFLWLQNFQTDMYKVRKQQQQEQQRFEVSVFPYEPRSF